MLFGVGSVLMRGAGCVINDLWDKDFDKRVERTKMRPLACGSLTERQAIYFLSGLLSTSLAVLMQLNWFRFLAAGLTFNWGALLGWSAIQGSLSSVPIALYLAALQWTLLYDTIYAHQDKADDIMIGVKSTALRFGENTKLWLTGFGSAAVAGLGLAGHLADQTWPYYVALAATSMQLGWQIGTLNIDDSSDCWKKFRSNSWLGAILFAGIVAGNLLKEEKKIDLRKDDSENES
ncbi:putative 4-hydroxybenzoate polyprenyl transferase [Ancylostoma ceylanicum]|uniref:Putative 4-hydroxybenzoate polyprenyl transferase n=1 Tax=Ancylostoma ceylanicum TaxID=53326 RepID=A0A0D6LI16_9BILA|nr:putative 4-hydroxybenzoate polyprenyl transferase [Ancylostoma ceylanicum]